MRWIYRLLRCKRGNAIGIISSLAVVTIGLGVISMVNSGFYNSIDKTLFGPEGTVIVHEGTDIAESTSMTLNYTVTNPLSGRSGSLSIAYTDAAGNVTNVSIGSTSIGSLSGSSPVVLSIPSGVIPNGVLGVTYDVTEGETVTDTNLSYTQCNGSETLDKVEASAWGGIGMATVIPYILVGTGVIGLVITGFGSKGS